MLHEKTGPSVNEVKAPEARGAVARDVVAAAKASELCVGRSDAVGEASEQSVRREEQCEVVADERHAAGKSVGKLQLAKAADGLSPKAEPPTWNGRSIKDCTACRRKAAGLKAYQACKCMAAQREVYLAAASCLFAEESCLIGEAAYHATWDDLSSEAKDAAFRKAVEEYQRWGCWYEGTDRPMAELKSEGVEVLSAAWRGHRAKVGPDGQLMGRLRWTPKGYQEWHRGADNASPTAAACSHRVLDVLGKQRGFVSVVVDWESAFFQQNEIGEAGPIVFCEVPEGDAGFVPGKRICRRLKKWVPGTKGACRGWYETLSERLVALGFEQSKLDPCVFYVRESDGAIAGHIPLHVDDARGRIKEELLSWLEETLRSEFSLGEFEVLRPGSSKEFVGERCTEEEDAVYYDQSAYVKEKLSEVQLEPRRAKRRDELASEEEVAEFRSMMMKCAWVTTHTRAESVYETSAAQSKVGSGKLKVADILRLNKLVRFMSDEKFAYRIRHPKLPEGRVKVVVIADCGEGEQSKEDYTKSQCGRVIGLMSGESGPGAGLMCVVEFKSSKCRRVTHSSFDGETISAVDGAEAGMAVALLVEEYESGVLPSLRERQLAAIDGVGLVRERVDVELYTDSKSLVSKVENVRMDPKLTKRRKQDVADLKEALAVRDLRRLVFHRGEWIVADPLTKPRARATQTSGELVKLLSTGWWEPVLG